MEVRRGVVVDALDIAKRVLGNEHFEDDVAADVARCTSAANSRLRCRACVEICPVEAVSVSRGKVEIDHHACTHCGACITVCPTQALSSRWLPWAELLSRCSRSIAQTEGRPVLACSVVLEEADRRALAVDETTIAEMPCLERVDEALLLAMAASGASEVRLVHGGCETCARGCMGAVWTLVSEMATDMLSTVGCNMRVVDSKELPDDVILQQGRGAADGVSRRDLFGNLRNDAKQTAGQVMEGVLGDPKVRKITALLGLDVSGSPLREAGRQKVCEWALGALVLSNRGAQELQDSQGSQGSQGLPTASEAIHELDGAWLPGRVFGTPRIDPDSCVNCFLCTAYCKSGALQKLMDGHRVEGFSIRPFLCSQCGACSDICRPGAIVVEPGADLTDILCERELRETYESWDVRRGRGGDA